MKQKLTERYIIDLMKEEWNKKIHSLIEMSDKQTNKPKTGLNAFAKIGGKREDVLSAAIGLKVKKKASKGDPMAGINYDVSDVNIQDNTITLKRPASGNMNTKKIIISLQDFEDNYERG